MKKRGGKKKRVKNKEDEKTLSSYLALRRVLGRLRRLHPLANPVAPRPVRDVHELVADRAAVGLAEAREHLAQRADRPLLAQKALHLPGPQVELAVEVRLGEAVGRRVELRGRRGGAVVQAQWVEVGHEVAVDLVPSHEQQQLHRLVDGLRRQRSRRKRREVRLPLLEGVVGLGDGLCGNPSFERAEEARPRGVDRGGVVAVALLELLYVC